MLHLLRLYSLYCCYGEFIIGHKLGFIVQFSGIGPCIRIIINNDLIIERGTTDTFLNYSAHRDYRFKAT